MARLDELTSFKTEIMSRIANNQNICKALYYKDHTDFLEQPDLENPRSTLFYKNIFPHKKLPMTQDEANTYITISTRFRKSSPTFKEGYIYVYIITHIDLLKTSYGALRHDMIAHEIDKVLNKEQGIGIGELEFDEFDETLFSGTNFIGQFLRYKPIAFN